MGEHAERTEKNLTDEDSGRRHRTEADRRRIKDQAVGLIAGIVRWAGLVFAAILVLQVIFTVGSANPVNGIVSWVRGWADGLAMGFRDLFQPSDEKLRVLVNYGIAALFWLIASAIVAKLVRRIGGISA
ncbi:hypothetical protein FNH05_04240 [Amycolatopsis rhizosphaerae]|uniref:Uncharacterized protein n=1 Tax=Amycolatopsis rhizosphaerae TaxID=2053003 RepID=A0A558DHK5_9PSEU|nr:hypothetical protein [Amycolatopsis rhizosphaerae]TVT60519.1 hypothetical protein FNH05_04240 [Amycolatopsis rhizosphaerae]